jgi:hypothetical protein
MAIPSKYVSEFMKNPRLTRPGGTAGTKPADRAVMKKVITETLSDPAFMEQLVNYAMKQGTIKLR